MPIYQDIIETIGKTPVVRINHLTSENNANVYVKLEKFNPGGSIKDRTALGMVLEAERQGKIKPGDTLVEPTSGNTGIGLAMIAVVRGYNMVLTMPDTMSFERRALLEHLGAEIVLSAGEMGMQGAIELAQRMVDERGYFMVYQFSNPANPKIHEETTVHEILSDFRELGLDCLVCGVGTGGTLSGVGKILKETYPKIQNIAVEPYYSPVISGGEPGFHGIQGIGAGFVPENYHPEVVDRIMQVREDDAYEIAREASRREGLLIGISSGASLWAALQVAQEMSPSQNILTILPDGAEHYMSTPLFLHKKRFS